MIKKIHHIGIVVRDLNEAYRFYRDTLGLTVAKEAELPDQGVKACLLPVGHSEIELLEPIREGTGIARFLESRGEGMHHLCFETDNIDSEIDRLKGMETPLIDQQARSGLAGMIAFVHPKCTHKTLIELATPPAAANGHHDAAEGAAGARDLDYVTLAVPDVDAAAADYQRMFGLKGGESFDLGEAGGRGVMLPVGEAYLELLSATSPESHVGRMIAEAGEGMLMLTLEVRDVEKAIQHLRANNVSVSDARPGPLPKTRSARVDRNSTHGVVLQLMQR